jgi:hypothetical protein
MHLEKEHYPTPPDWWISEGILAKDMSVLDTCK